MELLQLHINLVFFLEITQRMSRKVAATGDRSWLHLPALVFY